LKQTTEKMKEFISIVIPAYNEAQNISSVLSSIHEILRPLPLEYEVIFIDDGSTDNTAEIIEQIRITQLQLHYIKFSRNFGHQAALKAGIDHARGLAIISMDADLQHPPGLIIEMIERWKEGYEIIYTQRRPDPSLGWFKKITSRWFYKILRTISDVRIEEGTADFRLIDRKVADIIKTQNDPFLFIRGLIPWMGFKQYKMVYDPAPRLHGSSKYTLRKMTAFAVNGITGFSIKPLRVAIILGLIISFLSFLYGLYAIWAFLYDDRVISGWASVITSILFIGGIQLIILGIIGEYIGKAYLQSKNRPFYIISESTLEN
jgi:glycosyltransferase involved in cell wall biosynthesis